MFAKHDKYLKIFEVVVYVAFGLMILGSVVGSIILMADSIVGGGLMVLIGGLLLSFFILMLNMILVSALLDLKLVRDKLYGVNESANTYGITVPKGSSHLIVTAIPGAKKTIKTTTITNVASNTNSYSTNQYSNIAPQQSRPMNNVPAQNMRPPQQNMRPPQQGRPMQQGQPAGNRPQQSYGQPNNPLGPGPNRRNPNGGNY